ncbi:MAG: hypothetical protein GXO29_07640 [Thermotogae bacterium]|nr:hypothetical protein [Thermotogota bacterium]
MNQLAFLFFGLFVLSMFLYLLYPERIRLWTLLGLASFSAGLMGAFRYPDPYVLATFGVALVGGLIGWVIFSRRKR